MTDFEQSAAICRKAMEVFGRMPKSAQMNIVCNGIYARTVRVMKECEPMSDEEIHQMDTLLREFYDATDLIRGEG